MFSFCALKSLHLLCKSTVMRSLVIYQCSIITLQLLSAAFRANLATSALFFSQRALIDSLAMINLVYAFLTKGIPKLSSTLSFLIRN